MEIIFKTTDYVSLSMNVVSENNIELEIFDDDSNGMIMPLSYSELETIKDCIDSILKKKDKTNE